jgi:hypothetical protein
MKFFKKLFSNSGKEKNNLFKYIYVELDGNVRELNSDEKEYLSEDFHPNDGARPYIKNSYYQLTPDNKINGFLERNKLPKDIISKID